MPQLIIAEKPSVAQSIAKVLGVTGRCNGYLENSAYIVSWCVGHLVELAPPGAYNENYARWSLNDLQKQLDEIWKVVRELLAKLAYNIGAFGLTPLLLLYLYAFVYIITHQQYEQLIIVAIAVVGTLGIAFAAAFLVIALEAITDHMMQFMWS